MKGSITSTFLAVLLATSTALFAQEADSRRGQPEPPVNGIHWARGEARNGGVTNSPLLIYHGGNIMQHVQPVQAIFWGSSWSSAAFTGDKMTGMDTFYSGIGNTTYAHTCSEYSGAGGVFVGDSITYIGHLVDTSPAANGSRTGQILAEVCTMITNPQANGYYPVYVDIPRGHANYCAYHSAGTCNGVPVQFGFFFHLDGDPGCDPEDTSGLHSQGLSAIANVSGHELSEARTDPWLNAWYDNSGNENGDKCAWSFGTSLLSFTNSSQWKIQGNWSNAAYTASSGYANLSGQPGCIDGGKYK